MDGIITEYAFNTALSSIYKNSDTLPSVRLDDHIFPSWQTSWMTENYPQYGKKIGPTEQTSSISPSFEIQDGQAHCEQSFRDFQEKRWVCSMCTQTFSARKSLHRHAQSVHSSNSYTCQHCHRSFARKDVRDRHQQEKHSRIDLVECMRCGQKVRDRSLKYHLDSDRCRAHKDVTREQEYSRTAPDTHSNMLAPILEQTEEDRRMFKSLSCSDTCDPLTMSAYLSCTVRNGLEILKNSRDLPLDPAEVVSHLLRLRGLVIRSIIRGLAAETLDDVLHGAIRTFASTELMLHPEAYKIHSNAVVLLETQRNHRLEEVLALSQYALKQWNTTTASPLRRPAANTTQDGDTPTSGIALEVEHLSQNRLPLLELTSSQPLLLAPTLEEAAVTRNDVSPDSGVTEPRVSVRASRKRKIRECDAPRDRFKERITCPREKCPANIVRRALNRHLASVHGEGKLYECTVCTKPFVRRDLRDRHHNNKHGEGSEKVKCGRCGTILCRRSVDEHSRRLICQKKEAVDKG